MTVKQAAQIMGVTEQFVRVGLQQGMLPFGTAVKFEKQWSYLIIPKRFYEFIGKTEEAEAQQAAH